MLRYLRDGLIVLAVTLGMLVVFELALRFAFPSRVPGRDDLMRHDRYIAALDPGFEGIHERNMVDGGHRIAYKINEYGFRGATIPNGTRPDIMVFGDSNVQAVFSEEEATFVAQLRNQLSKMTGQSLFAINAGVKGYGPDQVLVRMRDEIERWHPKLIVVVLYAGNDYGDLIRNRLFKVDPSERLIAYGGNPEPGTYLPFAYWLATQKDRLMLTKLANKVSDLMFGKLDKENTHEYISSILEICQKEYENYLDTEGGVWSGDHHDLDVALMPGIESSRAKRRLMAATIREIGSLVEKYSTADLIFVVLPSRVDASTNDEITYKILETISNEYTRLNLVKPIIEALEENELNYVDLSEPFMKDGRSPYYFLDDGHWNDAGQALAAKLVANHVITHRRQAGRPGRDRSR